MAIPRVFIASTCYDLKYIRSNLKYLIESLGYDPVLSEFGRVFYNPEEHTHDSCLNEVENSQLFILIIGGRYGGNFKNSDKSITNKEYEKAIERKIPIFTLIEQNVYSEHLVYTKNKNNTNINIKDINFPSVDSIKIFEFIDIVRKQTINNAIHPFDNFNDIENYIKNQFAGLFFSYLTNASEERRVVDIVEQMLVVNDKIEYISSQLLKSADRIEARVLVELYSELVNVDSIRILSNCGIKTDPVQVLLSENFLDLSKRMGIELVVSESPDFSASYGANNSIILSRGYFNSCENNFSLLKKTMNNILGYKNVTLKMLEDYINA